MDAKVIAAQGQAKKNGVALLSKEEYLRLELLKIAVHVRTPNSGGPGTVVAAQAFEKYVLTGDGPDEAS